MCSPSTSYFYPRPPRGGRPGSGHPRPVHHHFYPRPPRGGRPTSASGARSSRSYFYPRPPRGGRPASARFRSAMTVFLSTPSARRATSTTRMVSASPIFLSTPSARRATRIPWQSGRLLSDFYPRPPRGGRPQRRRPTWTSSRFLSTPSARRATGAEPRGVPHRKDFYPRPPRGGRLPFGLVQWPSFTFLSTPSARRATAKTERKYSAFVSLYTSLHKLQRDACKTNRKITPLLAQTAGIPVRSVPENHVRFLFALAGHHPDIKRSAHYPAQIPGAVQRARPWSGNCCPAGRIADYPRQGRSGRSALP